MSKALKFVIDDKIPFIKGVLEPFANVFYISGNEISKQHIIDADALIIRTRTICNEALLAGTSVKFIATATIGYDHIDTAYCSQNGIIWKNAPGCNAGSVMQYVASALVYFAEKYNFLFTNRCLGVVGVGNVGKKVVRLGEALGMRVVLNDPPIARRGACGYISLAGLLREADIISVHVPLLFDGDDKTYHLFENKVFEKCNPATIFINTSRGEVADTASLFTHIGNRYIQAGALDVWENEPNIDTRLLMRTNIATPHIAGYSVDGKARGTAMAVNSLSAYFHLGLTNWQPQNLPLPASPTIEIDCKKLSHQQAICKAIKHTYNIETDDASLRNSPQTFEQQRGNYAVRREFSAYTVKLLHANPQTANSLKMLGFGLALI